MSRLKRFISDSFQMIPLQDGVTRIGRSTSCELVLRSPVVSKLHAVIDCNSEGCFLKNESSNGTRVNDVRLTGHHPLKHGDKIQIGMELLLYVESEQIPGLPGFPAEKPSGRLSDDPDESIRHQLAQPGRAVKQVTRTELSRTYAEKIAARISLRDQSIGSLASTDSVRKLSQMLRLIEAIRSCRDGDRFAAICETLYSLFPGASQIVIAEESAPRDPDFRVTVSHCRNTQEPAFVCQDIIHHVARLNECLLLADQWRETPDDKPRLSSMGRIAIMCVPIRTAGERPNGIVQIIGQLPEAEFEIRDLERLAILAQLLTIVMPLK